RALPLNSRFSARRPTRNPTDLPHLRACCAAWPSMARPALTRTPFRASVRLGDNQWVQMKALIFAVCALSAFGELSAQTCTWQPAPGHTQVPIWPGEAPGAHPVTGQETSTTREKDHLRPRYTPIQDRLWRKIA